MATGTLPKIFLENYREFKEERIAMRRKHLGLWQEYTWKDSFEHVKWLCYGLLKLGLQSGDKISIIGENDPEWYWAEYAAQSAHAVPFGILQEIAVQ